MPQPKTAIVVGAGPAGLTVAYELLTRTNIKPIILEQSSQVGGIAKTINHHGNHLDIGGHRFFTKSARVNQWWFKFLPPEKPHPILAPNFTTKIPKPKHSMLIRERRSHILYQGKLFPYPLQVTPKTLQNLGLYKLIKILLTYSHAKLFPQPETNLESFFINRFGTELYHTFFKSYTEKVWGIPCNQLGADWGRQRIKGMSVSRAIHFSLLKLYSQLTHTTPKHLETSLTETFLYPPKGPGQLWQMVAKQVESLGGQILFNHQVKELHHTKSKITQITAESNHQLTNFSCHYCFSTMPIKHLVAGLTPTPPKKIQNISLNLPYRDFITVGLLIKTPKPFPQDNWIYIHDPKVTAGRIQFFNNWSPYLVKDKKYLWLGLEYFTNHTDPFWLQTDDQIIHAAQKDLETSQLFSKFTIKDSVVVRQKKAYPTYTGSYQHFDKARAYLDKFQNLFLIGRNGMHRYNNQDHSILSALTAVDNIISRQKSKSNIWQINTESDYHESK